MSTRPRTIVVATAGAAAALILGVPAASDAGQSIDRSIPPEARYVYVVPDKVRSGKDYGQPVFETLKEPPPAPETRFKYYVPEKATGDYGRPVFEPLDERWVIPEKRFKYFSKDFPKFDIATADFTQPPTTYPEVRFKYYYGPKAAPRR